MAAKPIERFVKKQIADQGGWPRPAIVEAARTLQAYLEAFIEDGQRFCPVCERESTEFHLESCYLGQALRDVADGSKPER